MTTTATATLPGATEAHAAAPRPAPRPDRGSRGWWSSILPAPTPRLALVAGLVALPAALYPPLLWLEVLVGLAGLVDAFRAPAPHEVPVARQFRDVVPLGEEVEVAWVVKNPTRRPARVRLADELAPSLRLAHRVLPLDLGADTTAFVASTLRPSRRGRFALQRVTVRVEGPWGLATRQHTRDLPGSLDVHPTFHSRREAELRITRGRILEVGMRSARALGRGTDFEALREYTIDDEFRRIDWAATARRGRPIVRTYRAERNQTVQILLDTGRLMAGVVGGVPRLDHAMDAAMALTTVATRLGDRAGLIAFSSGVRATVPPRGDRQQLARVTSAIFALEPDLTESAYEDVFSQTVALRRRRSLLVLLTELATEALPETLIPALPLLLRHHLVIVGSVRDPDIDAWREQPAADTTDAYRAAGAVTVRRARDRTADLLRRLGATVVDAPPGEFAGRLADAYLDVKATGRL